MLPVLSVTVPVMPPRVCGARAYDVNPEFIHTDEAARIAMNAVLFSVSMSDLSMSDPVQVCKANSCGTACQRSRRYCVVRRCWHRDRLLCLSARQNN